MHRSNQFRQCNNLPPRSAHLPGIEVDALSRTAVKTEIKNKDKLKTMLIWALQRRQLKGSGPGAQSVKMIHGSASFASISMGSWMLTKRSIISLITTRGWFSVMIRALNSRLSQIKITRLKLQPRNGRHAAPNEIGRAHAE